jgi:hypothetical protein
MKPIISWKPYTYKCELCDFKTNNKIVYLNHIGKAHKLKGANRP